MHFVVYHAATIIGIIPTGNYGLSCILPVTAIKGTADLGEIFIVFKTCLFCRWSSTIMHFKIGESVPLAYDSARRGGLGARSMIIG